MAPAQEWSAREPGVSGRARFLARIATVLALGAALAACGRCGDFLSSSLGESACHSDHAPQ